MNFDTKFISILMVQPAIELIGVYSVDKIKDVSLVEILIGKKADEIEITGFTQEIENEPRRNWQSPFLEKYLDIDGKSVIGDDFELPQVLTHTTRLAFFIYFLDTSKPLITPFGKLALTRKVPAPSRIKNLIRFDYPE